MSSLSPSSSSDFFKRVDSVCGNPDVLTKLILKTAELDNLAVFRAVNSEDELIKYIEAVMKSLDKKKDAKLLSEFGKLRKPPKFANFKLDFIRDSLIRRIWNDLHSFDVRKFATLNIKIDEGMDVDGDASDDGMFSADVAVGRSKVENSLIKITEKITLKSFVAQDFKVKPFQDDSTKFSTICPFKHCGRKYSTATWNGAKQTSSRGFVKHLSNYHVKKSGTAKNISTLLKVVPKGAPRSNRTTKRSAKISPTKINADVDLEDLHQLDAFKMEPEKELDECSDDNLFGEDFEEIEMVDADGTTCTIKVPNYDENKPPTRLIGFGTNSFGLEAWSADGKCQEFWRTGVQEDGDSPIVRASANEIHDAGFDKQMVPDEIPYPSDHADFDKTIRSSMPMEKLKPRPIYDLKRSAHGMLDILNNSATHHIRGHKGNKYSICEMNSAAYDFCKNGRGYYKTKAMNLPVPSVSTVKRFIGSLSPRFEPGKIYSEEAKNFLVDTNNPMHVVITVDCTRVSAKVEFDAPTQSLIGLTAPFDPETGLPDMSGLKNLTVKGILNALQSHSRSSFIEVFMIKPLQIGSASIPISVIPTDNCFTAGHVIQRILTITKALNDENISVECFASDGDTKYMKAQKHLAGFGKKKFNFYGFPIYGDLESVIGAMQDGKHLLNKMKMRLFNPDISLFPGEKLASLNDITSFYNDKNLKLTKFEHGLNAGDIKNSDRTRDKMNSDATLRICDIKVLECLKLVPGSEATQEIIRCMIMLREVLVDAGTDGSKIIYNMVYVTSFFRIWREYLRLEKIGASHFFTPNVWTCIELNMLFIARLAEKGLHKLAHILNSQVNEEFFRTLRSMSSSLLTNINFTTKECLQKMQYTSVLMMVTRNLRVQEGLSFAEKFADTIIPDNKKFAASAEAASELISIVQLATLDAKKSALNLGMNCGEADPTTILSTPPNRETLIEETRSKQRQQLEPRFQIKSSVVDDQEIVSVGALSFIEGPLISNQILRVTSQKPLKTEHIQIQTFLNLFDTRENVPLDRSHRFWVSDAQAKSSQQSEPVCRLTESYAVLTDCMLGDWIVIHSVADENCWMTGKVSKLRKISDSKLRKHVACADDFFAFDSKKPQHSFMLAPLFKMKYDETSLLPKKKPQTYFSETSYVVTIDPKLLDVTENTFSEDLLNMLDI